MSRILVITSAYPPERLGGYELSCQDVVGRWRRRGHQVEVLTGRARGSEASPEAGIRWDLDTYFKGDTFERWPIKRCLSAERHDNDVLKATIERFDPEVVSVWHMAGIPMSLLSHLLRRRLPLVAVVCDEWPGYLPAVDPWMRRCRRWPWTWGLIEDLTGVPTGVPDLDRYASFCFVSHYVRDRCVKRSPWMFPRSTVTYSGIDPADFPLTARREPRVWSGRLLAVGRLDPVKGFDTAIRALVHLDTATLEIVSTGDGTYRRELEGLASDCGVRDRVTFSTGDRVSVRARLLDADALIFPSVWAEPFGLVPVEAMASSVPVVATGTGGSGEFLHDGDNCLLFAPGDALSLSGAIEELAGSEELRRRVTESGLTTAGLLTVDALADQLEEWHLAASGGFAEGLPGPPRDMRKYLPAGSPV
jgi:glycogen(starch) synthase